MSYFITQDGQYVSSYVAQCKRKQQKTENDRKVISCSSQKSDNDVIIIEDKVKSRQIAKHKLFQFHENYRPAYYGTWQKSSTIIRPRNPFKKDEVNSVTSDFNLLIFLCLNRHYWITLWIVMMNGRKRSQGKVYLTVIVG